MNTIKQERRKYPRVWAHFRVNLKFDNKDKSIAAMVKDMSEGGLYFKTQKQLGPNDIVEINFTLPNRRKKMKIIGQVVRLVTSDENEKEDDLAYGAGVKFVNMQKGVSRLIKKFLNMQTPVAGEEI